MKSRQQVSRTAIDLIKRFEGYRRRAVRLPDGRWTIGYGHTLTAREGAEVSEADAEALLIYDLIAVAHTINEQVFTPLAQNQFDALCAFVFNIGIEAFKGSSVLRRLNAGELIQGACAMELWRRADVGNEQIVVDALVRRRAAEKTLFLTPPGGWVPVPTPVLRPRLDADVLGLVPSEPPTALEVTLRGDRVVVMRAGDVLAPADEAPAASATETAAAAVASRLHSIFPDTQSEPGPSPAPEPEPAAFPAAEAPPEAEPAVAVAGGGPVLVLTPPQAEEAEPAAPAARATIPAAANESEPGLFDRPFAPPPGRKRRRKGELPRLLGLGVVGLGLFAWALFSAFNARVGQGEGLFSPIGLAWVAGVAGVAAFGVAAYLVLERLGGTGED